MHTKSGCELVDGEVIFSVERSELPIDLSITSTTYVVLGQGDFKDSEAGEVDVPDSMPCVKGIYLGGCIASGIGRISDKVRCELAHAHIRGKYVDWICYQLPEYFHDPAYRWLRRHELAHVISGRGHDQRWRKIMRVLGEEIPERYRYRPRSSQT